jgi:hypothetical protein
MVYSESLFHFAAAGFMIDCFLARSGFSLIRMLFSVRLFLDPDAFFGQALL